MTVKYVAPPRNVTTLKLEKLGLNIKIALGTICIYAENTILSVI